MINVNTRVLDDLAARIGKAIEGSPAKDIEKNVKALLQSGLLRLDLVTRQEFDTQAQVLLRTREKVERLEARLAEMEGRAPSAAGIKSQPVPPSIAPAE
jgi:BMFP domain-containing protein YqiC